MLKLGLWIFLLNGSQSVEASSEKRRQQLIEVSFVAAALVVLALLTIRLGPVAPGSVRTDLFGLAAGAH